MPYLFKRTFRFTPPFGPQIYRWSLSNQSILSQIIIFFQQSIFYKPAKIWN